MARVGCKREDQKAYLVWVNKEQHELFLKLANVAETEGSKLIRDYIKNYVVANKYKLGDK